MDAPAFTLHRYFETYRETEYKEFIVDGLTAFPNDSIMGAQSSEAARLVAEEGKVRYLCSFGSDIRPDEEIGILLTDETFSQRECTNLWLYSAKPITIRVLVHHYRR